MSEQPPSFDDPALRDALRRQWPDEPATVMTRARIQGLFRAGGDERAAGVAARPAGRSVGRWVGLAASLLLTAGLLGILAYWGYEAYEQWEYVEANRGRFSEMAAVHASAGDAPADFDTPTAAAKAAGRPVATLAADVAGWRVDSVGTATVSGERIVRVTYATDGRRVSVLSLPATALVDAHDGFAYTVDADRHTLVGAVRGDSVFCVIADPGIPPADVERLAAGLHVVTP